MKGPLNKLEMDIFTWRNVHFQFVQWALHTASWTFIFMQIIQYYDMKLTWMDSAERAEYSRSVFINNIAHIYVSTEAVWRARWINWKWTFSHKEMSISNLFSGPYILLPWTFIFMQIIQYYDMKLTWMDPVERAECSRSVFINNIAHIYVSTEAVWRCPFPIYQRALHTASVDSNFLCKIRHFMCFSVHGAIG